MIDVAGSRIALPILRGVSIKGYGLYPGDGEGAELVFMPGLTLILGANGLGKTTLVLMLYRLLSGPFDIPGLDDNAAVGTTRIEAVRLPASARAQFARRVSDGARAGIGELEFTLGDARFVVQRRLSDLALQALTINGQEYGTSEVEDYQAIVVEHAGLSAFGDWILLLRHLIFYFEDRRALVWDPSAQRQLLRLLFLPARTAGQWSAQEREILQLDSHMRNLQAALTREEREIVRIDARVQGSSSIRAELQVLEPLQEDDRELHRRMEEEILALDVARREARQRVMESEQRREVELRNLERAKLLAIGSSFPSATETGRFVLSQLMASGECLVCGHAVPAVAARLSRRIVNSQCVVCGSALGDEHTEGIDAPRVARAIQLLENATQDLVNARLLGDQAIADFDVKAAALEELGGRIATRAQRLEALIAALPPEEAEIHRQRNEISFLRTRVSQLRDDLDSRRTDFSAFIEQVSRAIVVRATEIDNSFVGFARGFLLEDCDLVWAPHAARVGQTGQSVMFPSFELSLSGSDFVGPTRRGGPTDVSESQREFIDLAFRMALMHVAGREAAGSLVIDAPESSLDGVFAPRAADVLVRFSQAAADNRLVITSNLVEGSLLPALVERAIPPGEQDRRVVDLLDIARPTAAVREYGDSYRGFRDRLLGRDGG